MAEQQIINHWLILDRARELADMISNSSEVDFFKRAEKQIKANVKAQELIAQIKKKQKEVVNLEHFQRFDLMKKAEEEMNALQDELDGIPIVREFKQSQMDINDLLQMVTNVIANTVSEKITVSTGGNPLYGETGYEKEK